MSGEPRDDQEAYEDRRRPERDEQRRRPNGQGTQPVILVAPGKRHEAADAGLTALRNTQFFTRDKSLVRVCRLRAKASDGSMVLTPAVVPVAKPTLARALGRAARWQKLNRKGVAVAIDPPHDVIDQIAEMIDEWQSVFQPLIGIISTPTMRPDGSLLIDPGYDERTGYFLSDPPTMLPIPLNPTVEDATAAAQLLAELIEEFPFKTELSRSVALSMLVTPVVRPALGAVPLHACTAPSAGSGKSYLQDIASAIAYGERCSVLSAGSTIEELEKRLTSAAIEMRPIVALDNVSCVLMGDLLCQMTERPIVDLRPLGISGLSKARNTYSVFANGNNLIISADQVRRTIQCALDAKMENPDDRQFQRDPVAMVLADRGRYVRACLTICRAYLAAGRPNRLPPRPSYESWSDTVRSALVWLGYQDPIDSTADLRAADPERQKVLAVFSAWAKSLQDGIGYYVAEVIRVASETSYDGARRNPDLWEALIAVAPAKTGGVEPRELGKWLGAHEDTVCGGFRLTSDRSNVARPRWKVTGRRGPDQ